MPSGLGVPGSEDRADTPTKAGSITAAVGRVEGLLSPPTVVVFSTDVPTEPLATLLVSPPAGSAQCTLEYCVFTFDVVEVKKDTGVEGEGEAVPPEGAREAITGRGEEVAAATATFGLRPLLALNAVPRGRAREPEGVCV
jgi:hypothetical protein